MIAALALIFAGVAVIRAADCPQAVAAGAGIGAFGAIIGAAALAGAQF